MGVSLGVSAEMGNTYVWWCIKYRLLLQRCLMPLGGNGVFEEKSGHRLTSPWGFLRPGDTSCLAWQNPVMGSMPPWLKAMGECQWAPGWALSQT